jgi:hypothetical protein
VKPQIIRIFSRNEVSTIPKGRIAMGSSGVRDVLIYCRDHRCSQHVEINAEGWANDVQLSDEK